MGASATASDRPMCYTPRMLRASPVLHRHLLPLLALYLLTGSSALAQSAAPGTSPWAATAHDEDLAIRLVTFGPGDAVHQYFGHNALVVEDTRRGISLLYNFGMFGFGPDMLTKYLQGQLEFWVAATPVRRTFRMYVAANRAIRVIDLNLPPAARRRLAERLAWWAMPENRTYRYHHYRNNCSTKLRDLLNEVTDGQLHAQYSTPSSQDYRDHTWRYTQHDPIIHFLLILWMNDSMELPIEAWHDAFLPNELERLVLGAVYTDADGKQRKLAGSAYTVFEARRAPVPERPERRWPGVLGFGLLLGALAIALGVWSRRGGRLARALFGLHHVFVGIALGVPGLVLFLFLFTEWKVTHWNENLWLVNPLTFAALPLGLMIAFGSKRALERSAMLWRALAAMTLLALALKVLPNYDQNNWIPLALLVPMNLGFALATRLARVPLGAATGDTQQEPKR